MVRVELDSDRTRALSIARARLSGAREYIAQAGLAESDKQLALSSRIEVALGKFEQDREAQDITAKWHNHNVRKMLPFLIRTCIRYSQATRQGGSLVGAVYGELIDTAMPSAMQEIYTPTFPEVRGKYPFVFLRLRILAYLYKRRNDAEPPPYDQMTSDFVHTFGLRSRDVEAAIRDLTIKDQVQGKDEDIVGALLRVQENSRKTKNRSVILPSGRDVHDGTDNYELRLSCVGV